MASFPLPAVRAPWLLSSIAVHSAAVVVVLMVGVHARGLRRPPVARIEIRNTPPSAPARTELRRAPEVEVEAAQDAQPLVEFSVPPAPEPAGEAEPVIDAGPLRPSPAAVLNQATTERVRAPAPPPPQPAPLSTAAPVEPAPPLVSAEESPPAFTAATRLDLGRDKPAYPQKERRLGREGTVVLRVSVRADGTVADASLKTPSRYAGFNRAALQAVRRWRFAPATERGVAVESVIDLPVVFELTDAGGR